MTHEITDQRDCEERLSEALLAYVEARQAGRELDRSQLLASYPDLRGELEEFFVGHDEVERLTVALRQGGEAEVESRADIGPSRAIGELGDFRLLCEIGRGGMGWSTKPRQISLRRHGVKVLPFAAALDRRQLQRFKNEALAAAHLRHENIVPVYMVGEERGVHYYAMQFIEGRSLANLIAEMKLQTSESPKQASLENGERELLSTSSAAVLSTERSSGSRTYYDWVARWATGGPGAGACPFGGSRSPRYKARQPAARYGGKPLGHRFRPGAGGRRCRVDRDGRIARDAPLCQSRASPCSTGRCRSPERHLLSGSYSIRTVDYAAAL